MEGKECFNFAYKEIDNVYAWRGDVKELRLVVKVV